MTDENKVHYILVKEYSGNRCVIERRRNEDNRLLTTYDAFYSLRSNVGKYTCYPERGTVHAEYTGKITLREREVIDAIRR